MTTTKHKPCPFCGGTTLRIAMSEACSPVVTRFVMCMTCKAEGPVRFEAEQAWEAWDGRAEVKK